MAVSGDGRRADLERHRRGSLLGRSGRQRLDRHQRRAGARIGPTVTGRCKDRRLPIRCITRLAGDRPDVSRVGKPGFSSLSYKSEQLVRFAFRLDEDIGATQPGEVVSFAGLSRRAGIGWRSGRGFVMDSLGESGCGGVRGRAEVVGNLVVAVGRSAVWSRPFFVSGAIAWPDGMLQSRENDRWKKRVRQRTAELESERTKVLEEKRRADEASEAKGRFLATMSHEIRTPLGGIVGGRSRLLKTMPDSPRRWRWSE